MSATIALGLHVFCDLRGPSNVRPWQFAKSDFEELNKQKDNILPLSLAPTVNCVVVACGVIFVLHSEHPASVLAPFHRDRKEFLALVRNKIVVRLIRAVLDKDIEAGLSQKASGIGLSGDLTLTRRHCALTMEFSGRPLLPLRTGERAVHCEHGAATMHHGPLERLVRQHAFHLSATPHDGQVAGLSSTPSRAAGTFPQFGHRYIRCPINAPTPAHAKNAAAKRSDGARSTHGADVSGPQKNEAPHPTMPTASQGPAFRKAKRRRC